MTRFQKKVDPNQVALITGEEKIIPSNAKYYLYILNLCQLIKI